MKTSARTALEGVVTEIKDGAVNSEVTLKIAGGVEIVAIVTKDAVLDLGLKVGSEATALIKSSFVILAVGDAPLKTSARNCLAGVVTAHERGAVNDKVVVDIAPGKSVTAVVTTESAQDLGLDVGRAVQVLIKAPHVILAVD
jgi:molybdate transport system regulatory protein